VYIFPSVAEACPDVTAPGGRKPYSPAPELGRVIENVRLTSFLPAKGPR